jgi:hypothetical protein
MTIDESIEVLIRHKLHWERLLSEGICDAHEGKETISALTTAIASLETWEKVRQEMEDYKYMPVHDLLFTLYRHLEEVQNEADD